MSALAKLIDREAERAYLAEVIGAPATLEWLRLDAEQFGDPRNATIARAVLDIFAAGEDVDPVAVRRRLIRGGQLERAGGESALLEIFNSATHTSPTAAAERIRELHRARTMRDALLRATARAEEGNVHEAAAIVQQLAESSGEGQRREVLTAHQAAVAAMEHMGTMREKARTSLVPTGIAELDGIVGGLEPGDLLTIGAQTNVGKSWVTLHAARAQSQAGDRAGVVSLEDPAHLWGSRLVAMESGVSTARIRRRALSQTDFSSIASGIKVIEGHGIDIAIATGSSCAQVIDTMRALVRERGSRCIWIDYAQALLMGGGGQAAHGEQRSNITAIKSAALRLGVPVVLLSQIKRGENPDREPSKYDLKEGGDLEIKSEMVVMMWRDAQHADLLCMKLDKSKVGGVGQAWAYRQLESGALRSVDQ